MQNKFFKKYTLLLFIFFSSYFFSQIKKINFLIMIDEKPCLIVNDLRLSSSSVGLLDANYIVGTINLSDENYNKLINDKSSNFDVNFETILPKLPLAQKYIFSLPKEFLNQKYIIINIFNKSSKIYKKRYSGGNKNNKEYYVVITSPDFSKLE
ncbi:MULTISPECIES: hypothetical protein [unclassified Chryseobacterium]|uniref:hypothetical protein n=1 Tax=unclassified Chryseobacterium TaxID=2593645 RepID=UPI001AE7AA1F|nr:MULTISPECIES: hypothetical protein [unclassified Chryseobacterium]MBP1165651.1 hypothetical protein [Chryseobacterium sp. PvR013]MDR4894420.1 hypothetical protein [Chryseobacterium sp. CFS7]